MSKQAKGDHHPGRKAKPHKVTPKRIFLFSDGTGNAASTLTKTNVWRMYQTLEKNGDDSPTQVALYDNGVGTSSFRPIMLVAGIFGFGLKQNVLDLYRFLCLQYEEGAEVYLIGFSRGAFTMRLLAAMVELNGILKVSPTEGGIHPTELNRAGNIAFQRLSNKFPSRNWLIEPMRWLRGIFTRKTFNKRALHFDDLSRHESKEITFMGIFETVSAYGGPVQEFTDAFSWLFFPTEPVDWSVGKHVKKVCHALALDEPRHSFWPKLVNETNDPGWDDPRTVPKLERGSRIEQVWFAGAHAHVGGGYANDGLSMIPLNWMFDKLKFGHDIRFDELALEKFSLAQDCCAPMADPRDGLGFIYRYNPRDLSRMTEDPGHNIYTDTPKIHHSVFDRMKHNPDYAPIALNRDYEIVDQWKAKEHRAVYDRKADFQVNEEEWITTSSEGAKEVPTANSLNPLFTGKRFNPHIEAAWDDVWLRRVIFAAQMFFMFLLVGSPWIWNSVENSSCENVLCFLREPVKGLATLLPGPAQPWVDVFSTNPAVITLLLVLFGLTIVYGRKVRHNINASLIDYWHYLVGRTDNAPAAPPKSLIYKLRNSSIYRFFFHQAKHFLMTVFFGFLIVATLVMSINQAALYIRDRTVPSIALCNKPTTATKAAKPFDVADLCVDTGVNVEKGLRYVVTIKPNIWKGQTLKNPWLDGDLPASPSGLDASGYTTILNVLSSSFKRQPLKPLFSPTIVIGQRFPKVQQLVELNPWPTKKIKNNPSVWEATFVATAKGRAYFYINDAALGPISANAQVFYANNKGTGTIKVGERFGPLP